MSVRCRCHLDDLSAVRLVYPVHLDDLSAVRLVYPVHLDDLSAVRLVYPVRGLTDPHSCCFEASSDSTALALLL
jgi:hypothetical protein